MYSCKFPHLFSPVTIAGVTFRNRLFASPTGASTLDSRHFPIEEAYAYYERKAIGGAASVCVGDCLVSPNARNNNGHIYIFDDSSYVSLAGLAESITRHGAVAAIELQHCGSHATVSAEHGEQLYGPSEYTNNNGFYVIEMTEEQILEVIDDFARCAATAKKAGFGMITIHGGHGWILTEFMSPLTNHRTDKWGGSVENRCRFAVEVVKAVRGAVGAKFPIEMRISGSECNPNGYGIETGIEIAKQLDGIVDLIHVSAGNHEVMEVFTVTHPDMFLPDGVNVKYAAEIKKHVTKSLVSTVGALSDPALMEEIIASGQADIVEVARGLIADPDLPNKARQGRDNEINRCMRCLACFSNLINTGHFICAINPEIGHEMQQKFYKPVVKKKNVLIAGGGIAGMRAAITAANRGHSVTLAEKSNELGGALKCERGVSFKKNLSVFLENQAREVQKAGVKVLLNTAVTKELAESLSPDVIIAAIGAKPIAPPVKGIENAVKADDIYHNIDLAGKKVVILGGGLVGSELAIHLSMNGREVTLVEMADSLNDGGNQLHGLAIRLELARRNVDIHLSTKAIEVKDGTLICENSGEQVEFTADTIIYAAGQRALAEEAEELRFCAPEYHRIGDCLNPKNITEATRLAYNIAMDI